MIKIARTGMLMLLLGQMYLTTAQQASLTKAASDDAARSAPVKVGEMAPDFTLEDVQGRKVSLSATRGQQPTLIFFFRGWW